MATLISVLVAALLYEGDHGTAAVRKVVYGAWWFDLVLGLLALNIFSAAAVRYPWQKRLTGFVITHAGLLVLLAGSFVTRHFGVEGRVRLPEGAATAQMFIPEEFRISVALPTGERHVLREEEAVARAGKGALAVGASGFALAVEEHLAGSREEERFSEDPAGQGPPALRLLLRAPMFGARDLWLLPTVPGRGEVPLGPLTVWSAYLRTPEEVEAFRRDEAPSGAAGASGFASVRLPGGDVRRVRVSDSLGKPQDLADGASLTIERVYGSARVVETPDGAGKTRMALAEAPGGLPAIEATIAFPGGSEAHVGYPDIPEVGEMPSLRGHGERKGRGYRVRYEPPRGRPAGNVLAVALAEGGEVLYRIEDSKGRADRLVRPFPSKEEVTTPWPGMTAELKAVLRSARRDAPALILDEGPEGHGFPAFRLRLTGPDYDATGWVRFGEPAVLHPRGGHAEGHAQATYEFERRPLGFGVRLLDFRKVDYPGTDSPASFESDVAVDDAVSGRAFRQTIRMNEPLRHGGFSFYQSSYETHPDGTEVSIFQVGRDPGFPLVAAGSVLIVFGIFTMFYLVPYFRAAVLCLAAAALAAPAARADDALEPLRAVAVQDGGRVKPLDVFARETVRIVTGRTALRRGEPPRSEEPLETLLRWLADPEGTYAEPLLRVRHEDLHARLGLRAGTEYVSAKDLAGNAAFRELLQSGAEKKRADRKPDPTESRAGELHGAFARVREIVSGAAPRIVALPHGGDEAWLTGAELSAHGAPPSPSGPDEGLPDLGAAAPLRQAYESLLAAVRSGDRGSLASSAAALAGACRSLGSDRQPPLADLSREVHYFRFDPLGWALWGYVAGLALLLATYPVRSRPVALLSGAPAILGVGLHVYGIVLRVLISGRPPITNMYESIIWVSFGAAFFGALFTSIQRVRLYLLAGSGVAWLGLSFAKASPLTLDPGISALVPVLRNNFWLSVHVPTVTLSYAAFALAMGLGHVTMGMALLAPHREDAVRRLSGYVYRAMQVGVVLLAAGTILGGVWAYYSWGRFWGWDPKEVGALVALLGYLAALHGRFAGWWREFGLAVSSVLSFQLVLVAWYGVNVLGVGLHSYGWSTGSLWIVVGIAAAEAALCGLAGWRLRTRAAAAPPPAAAL